MREFMNITNTKLYKVISFLTILLMTWGIVTELIIESWTKLIIHSIIVISVSIFLMIYPKKETDLYKGVIITLITIYIYTLFFFYPDTTLGILIVAFLPGIAIVFFHEKMFYLSLSMNVLFAILLFGYIFLIDKGDIYPHLYNDSIGNMINFLISQIILLLVFILTSNRMKRLQLYYEQIQKDERLRTTGQLAAAVAHEVRNPITVVSGFLQLYHKDHDIPDNVRRNFQLMLDELGTAEEVISDFLSLAKQDKEVIEKVNVNEAVNSVTDLLASYALINNVTFKIEPINDLHIQCNLIELKQVLVNLIKNAVEAMVSGGEISISACKEGNYIVIKIEDNGVGMTEEEVRRLGTPFYSLKSRGTGLGLMICFNVLDKYGGKIEFASKKDEGTTVFLYLKSY